MKHVIYFDYNCDSGMWIVSQNDQVIFASSNRENAERFIEALKEYDAQNNAKIL